MKMKVIDKRTKKNKKKYKYGDVLMCWDELITVVTYEDGENNDKN